MNRRQFVRGSALLPALLLASRSGFAAAGPPEGAFGPSTVRDLARMLGRKPYEAPDEKLPGGLKNLDYDQYRSIRFQPERALWRGKNLPFEAQLFHRCFFYKNRVSIFEVADGKATDLKYRKADFSFGEKFPPFEDSDLGCAGFRIHAPMNRPDYYESASSWARPTSALSPKGRHTAFPPGDCRSIRAKQRARNFRSSRPSGSSGRLRVQLRW